MLSDIAGVAHSDSPPDMIAKYQSFFLNFLKRMQNHMVDIILSKTKKIALWDGKARPLVNLSGYVYMN